MPFLKPVCVIVLLSCLPFVAHADDSSLCAAQQGTLITGQVVKGPKFKKQSQTIQGVNLTHTHLSLQTDDNQTYDVAIDNVFALDYVKNGPKIPPSLYAIKVGDRIEACGKTYTQPGNGIDWVHTSCGDTPTPAKPNGWLKIVNADGSVGANLEAGQNYCYLWGGSNH
jgi:hypothetical protein